MERRTRPPRAEPIGPHMKRRRPSRVLAMAAAMALFGRPLAMLPAQAAGAPCQQTGGFAQRDPSLPTGLGEVSGLVASMRYPGWGWMIRDSGNPASLYAVRLSDGGGLPVVREFPLIGARNVDWEDLVYRWGFPDGRLLIIESGQSGGNTFIYELPEPNPEGPPEIRNFTRYQYAYPNQALFNTESAFWYAGRLVLVTKTAPGQVYRFANPLSAGGINSPVYVGDLAGADRVSVVRVSWDWRTIVAADHQRLLVYRAPDLTRDLGALIARFTVRCELVSPGDNVEAGDFLPPGQLGLTLIAESRNIYQLPPEL
jgi:hypothetical protein